MNLYTRFYLVRKNFTNRKRQWLLIFLLTFSMLFIVIPLSFSKSLNVYFHDGVLSAPIYRTFFSFPKGSEQKTLKDLNSIDHVLDVYLAQEYFTVVDLLHFQGQTTNGSFFLYGSSSETLPKIISGRALMEEDEIVCPKVFYPNDNLEEAATLSNKNLILMENYIGESLHIKMNDSEKELKIVGIYQNNYSFLDENICYGTKGLISSLSDYNNDSDGLIRSVVSIVDDPKHMEQVKKDVQAKGYDYSSAIQLDQKFIIFLQNIMYFVVLIAMIMTIGSIIYMNKKNLKQQKVTINIYRSLGYSKKDVMSIIYLENGLIFFWVMMILCCIVFLVDFVAKILVHFYPFIFQKFPIQIDYFAILLAGIILSIVLWLTTYFGKKKILEGPIIYNIKD